MRLTCTQILVVTVLEAPACPLRNCWYTVLHFDYRDALVLGVVGSSLDWRIQYLYNMLNTEHTVPPPPFPHAAGNNAVADLLQVRSTAKDRGQPINQNGIPILQVDLHLNDASAVKPRGNVQ